MTTVTTDVPTNDMQAHAAPHLVVQILGLVLFAGFAIVSTVLAFVMYWPAGFALALAIAWFGFRPILGHRHRTMPTANLGPVVSDEQPFAPGNTSFTAYRRDVMRRLEDEQTSFEGFLSRLRAARDAREFDSFMEDRARTNRDTMAAGTPDDDASPRLT